MGDWAVSKKTYSFKNLLGNDVHLEIHKQSKSMAITLEQKVVSSLLSKNVLFIILGLFGSIVLLVVNRSIPPCIFSAILLVVFLLQILNIVRKESFYLIKSFGCEITTTYLVGKRSKFIPIEKVQRLFINEVILRDRVMHLLTILTKEENEQLVPLFVELKPRLMYLELICRHIRDLNL